MRWAAPLVLEKGGEGSKIKRGKIHLLPSRRKALFSPFLSCRWKDSCFRNTVGLPISLLG